MIATYIPPKNNKAQNIKIDDTNDNFNSSTVEGALKELAERESSDMSKYATKEDLKTKANKQHSHSNYSETTHNHNELYAVKSSEHNHSNKTIIDKITDIKIKEWDSKANGEHTHSNYSENTHNHNSLYANIEHEHEQYANSTHNHNELYAVKSSEHTHSNKVVLDKVTDTKINEWNNKANTNHTHDNYSPNTHNHDNLYAKKSETYTISQTDAKIEEEVSKVNVEIVDNLTSTSTTSGLSANQGKVLKEKLDEVFQSVSNGKELIASAITDKGVETSNTDTFETMATNIGSIKGGSDVGLTEGEIEEAKYWKTQANWSYRFYKDERTEIPQLDTSHVYDMKYMFYDCRNLTAIPQLDTSSVIYMKYMFYGCRNLTTIPQLDTSNADDMYNMFYGCRNLTTLPQLDTSRCENMYGMFGYCEKLTEIPFILYTSRLINMDEMFKGCLNLTHIRFDPNATKILNFNIKDCTKMTREDIIGMFESLPTIENSVTITMGATLLEKLTDEDKLIATNKGYTLS